MCNTILRLVDTYSLFKNDLQFVVTEWEISMRYETYKYYNKCRIFNIFVSYLFLVFERGIASIFISISVQRKLRIEISQYKRNEERIN